jgi:hypothetical protein
MVAGWKVGQQIILEYLALAAYRTNVLHDRLRAVLDVVEF